MASRSKILRSGYTTGACAAAAAKAATMLLISALEQQSSRAVEREICDEVEIPFPDGTRVRFKVQNSKFKVEDGKCIATASVIKDAGDDPDVTNGAEIVAEARMQDAGYRAQDTPLDPPLVRGELKGGHASCIMYRASMIIRGGKGVGIVTKPGLAIPVGEPAINPIPREMIKEAVMEAFSEQPSSRAVVATRNRAEQQKNTTGLLNCCSTALEIIISVPDGEKLAKRTLNHRLGIIGGISILGTTGIVKPLSSEAWTATIASSMDVATAMGYDEIVLSAGRASEKAHMKRFAFPEESYVMMGDYLEFALLEAKKHGFKKIHLCSQWAKMLKIAMATPQTHVRHGAIDIKKAVEFLRGYQLSAISYQPFNTAMEIFNFINSSPGTRHSALFLKVCLAAKRYAEEIAEGMHIAVHLVSYEGEIIAGSE